MGRQCVWSSPEIPSLQEAIIAAWASAASLPAMSSASHPSTAGPNSPMSASDLSTWVSILAYVLSHVLTSYLSRITVAFPITSSCV